MHARLGHSLACVLEQTRHLVPIWKAGEERLNNTEFGKLTADERILFRNHHEAPANVRDGRLPRGAARTLPAPP